MCDYVEPMMRNITLAVDEKVLEQARAYAEKRGTTLNDLVRELIDQSTGRLGPNYKWNRDEIYADRLLPGHQRSGIRSGRKKR
jgi:hypothetical protein